MFFHLSMNHYALLRTQIYFRLKVGLYNVICSWCLVPPHYNVWSCGILCRLVIGFGLESHFLSILVAKKGCDLALAAAVHDNMLSRGTFVWNLTESDGLHSGDYGQCGICLT